MSGARAKKTCGDCIHERACQTWADTCGYIRNADASACANFEALRESNVYYLGFEDGKRAKISKTAMTPEQAREYVYNMTRYDLSADNRLLARAILSLFDRLDRLEGKK